MTEETNCMNLLDSWDKCEEWFNKLDPNLFKLRDTIQERQREKKDLVIAITSPEEGQGKSTLSIILAFLIYPKLFDLVRNISYVPNADDIKKQFFSLDEGSTFIIDEAIKALYKMGFMTSIQQMLITLFATERWQRKVTFLCIPRLIDLTEQFRNHKVNLWIKILKRGRAVVHLRDKDNQFDCWALDYEKEYIKKRWRNKKVADITLTERLQMEREKRTYVMDIDFPELPKPIEDKYEQIKKEEHLEDGMIGDKMISEFKYKEMEDKYRKYCVNAIKQIIINDPDITQEEISDKLGFNSGFLQTLLSNNELKWSDLKKTMKAEQVSESHIQMHKSKNLSQQI